MNYDVDFNSKVDMNKHEMKTEEIVDAFRAGKGALSQMKEMPDGTKRFFNVYGDVHDGWDHILNIFMESSCVGPLFEAAIHGKLKTPEKKKENSFKGSETTVDYTDEAITWLLRNTDEKVYLEAYQRDEKKGFYDPAIEAEYEKKDGSLEVTGEKLQEDQNLAYVLIFAALRNHLEAEGFIDKLREINKYSGAGILVTATDEDHITARVVQGKSRPDLPCEMFLMGTITCRPYLDEMIAGSQISGMTIEERIKAAEDGDQDAMESLANSYLNGDETEQDFKESFKWWKRLAEAGSATAQFNTGLYYAKGCGVSRDFAKAAEWMQKAADNGDEDAANAVKAYQSADENLKKAQSGDAAAQAEIAKLYTQMGNSLEQLDIDNDYKEAFKWAKKSADQGNVDGLYILGLCYEHGRGTDFDYEKSNKAYETAAKKGHAPSQWNLACHYLRGFGDNEEEGLMFAYQAADQGYELAVKGLEESGNTVEKLKEFYEDPERIITLESTQYEGRADRCERIRVGDELTYKIVKDKMGKDALELFYKGGSVGLAFQHTVGKIIALLKMNRAKLKVTVKSCIPKSKRGARARNADVKLNMILTEIKPETPEEKQARLEREKKEREARLEKERKEREARAKAEEERRKAEEERRRREEEERRKREEEARRVAEEAKAKAEAEQKAWEEEAARIKAIREDVLAKRLSSIEEVRLKDLTDAESEKNNALSQCENALAETTKSVSDMESELSSLGFFAFGRKGELKKSIETGKQKIQDLSSQKDSIIKTYEEKVAAVNNKADKDAENARPDIEKEYPIPDSPEEKERKRKEEEARLKAEAEAKAKAEAERRAKEEAIRKEKSELEKVFSKWGSNKKNYLGVLQFLRVHPGIYDAHLWNYIPNLIGRDVCPDWKVMDALKSERLVEIKTVNTTNIYGYRHTIDLPFVTKTGEQFIEKYEKLWRSLAEEYPDPTNLPDDKISILAGDIMTRENGATMAKLLEDPILNKVGSSRLTGILRAEIKKQMMVCKNGEYFG